MEPEIPQETQRHDKFHQDLADLKEKLLKLAQLAEEAISASVTAFLQRDRARARAVLAGDQAINALEETIDGDCVRVIALFQPVAVDLRQLMAVDHIIAELERVGDCATNIAEETLTLADLPPRPYHRDLSRLVADVLDMLRRSLQAFLKQDTHLARDVCRADDEVDALDRDIIRDLLQDMAGEPGVVPADQCQIIVVRNLERVGDHATNIAEQVVYMVEGESIRHRCQR